MDKSQIAFPSREAWKQVSLATRQVLGLPVADGAPTPARSGSTNYTRKQWTMIWSPTALEAHTVRVYGGFVRQSKRIYWWPGTDYYPDRDLYTEFDVEALGLASGEHGFIVWVDDGAQGTVSLKSVTDLDALLDVTPFEILGYIKCAKRDEGTSYESLGYSLKQVQFDTIVATFPSPWSLAVSGNTFTITNPIFLRSPVYVKPNTLTFSLAANAGTGDYYAAVKINVSTNAIDSTLLLDQTFSNVVYTTLAAANADGDYMRLFVGILSYVVGGAGGTWYIKLRGITGVPELGLYV